MKNKRFLSLILSATLLANFAVVSLAAAESATSDQQLTTVALAFNSIPTVEDFSNVSASVGAVTSDHDFAGIVRIQGAVTLVSGLELTATATPFYSTNNYGTSFAPDQLQWQTDDNGTIADGGTSSGITCSNLDDVTAYTALTTGSGDGSVTDQSDPVKLVDDATTGNVNFDCTLTPQMRLTVPAGQGVGTYRTTLTLSLSDA